MNTVVRIGGKITLYEVHQISREDQKGLNALLTDIRSEYSIECKWGENVVTTESR